MNWKMRSLILALLILCSGCAAVEVAGEPSSFAACTVADTVSTVIAVQGGYAREINPLLSGSVNAHRFIPLVLSKLVVIGIIYWIAYQWNEQTKLPIAGMSAITCGVAASNGLIILKGIRP